jgi:sulfotransferase 6B1
MLVSQVFFATDMHEEHGMHAYYNSLPDFGARLNVAITGIDQDGLRMVSVKQRYEGVFAWLEQKNVMCIRFEDLINNRDATLLAMLDEVEKTGYKIPTPREKALPILVEAIQPKKSHTFRSGKQAAGLSTSPKSTRNYSKMWQGDLLVDSVMRKIMTGNLPE